MTTHTHNWTPDKHMQSATCVCGARTTEKMMSYAETFKRLVVNEDDDMVKKDRFAWGRAMETVGGDTGHRTGPMGHTIVGFTDGSAFEFERIGGDYYFVRCHAPH